MEKIVREIAALVDGTVSGDEHRVIRSLASLEDAGADDLAFAVPPHIDQARSARAGVLLLPRGTEGFAGTVIFVDDPKAAFAHLLSVFTPVIEHAVGVSEKAYIGQGVRIGEGVTVLPFAYVDDYAVLGSGVTIYPHAYIGQYSEIGAHTIVYPNATIREHCRVGAHCTIHSNAVIGADGFGFTTEGGVHTKVPQVGGVVIEDDVRSAHMSALTVRRLERPPSERARRSTTLCTSDITAPLAPTVSLLRRRASQALRRSDTTSPSAGRWGLSDISISVRTQPMRHVPASSAICRRVYSAPVFPFSRMLNGCVYKRPSAGCRR